MSQKIVTGAAEFTTHYPDRPFLVRHNLADHPLFQFERLLELEKALPDKKVDYFTGKVGINEDKYKTSPTGLTAEETIRRIRDCESWLVLKNIEQVPEYRELVMACLEEMRAVTQVRTPGLRQFEGWIFITSPGSVSPYHLDPEHNFLLQILGEKRVHVFDPDDKSVLSEKELEDYFSEGSSNAKLEYDEGYEEKVNAFVINPGEGVYMPPAAPHWVKVEKDVSISLSVSFYSKACDRMARLYRFNSMIRRVGLTPTPYGRSRVRDNAKDAVISAWLKARGIFGG